MKNLIVYGDSFNAPRMGLHWSELLSKKHNLNLISLASSGSSSRYVAFQMLHALEYPTNSIIIGSHSYNPYRIEYAVGENDIFKQDISINSFVNFNYGSPEAFIKSETVLGILSYNHINSQFKDVILTKMPVGLNAHFDKWAIFYGLSMLKDNNATFFYIPNLSKEHNLFDDNYLISKFGREHIITKDELDFEKYTKQKTTHPSFEDIGFHTEIEDQKVIASIIENRLIKQGLLSA